MPRYRYDDDDVVVIVGSGAGGGTLANELCQKGVKVVVLAANASDDIGVVGVQFLLDGAAIGPEVTALPYSINWDATTATSGSHTLAARARDNAGRQTTSAAVTVTIAGNRVTPTITWLNSWS